jgi:hypothetical protein
MTKCNGKVAERVMNCLLKESSYEEGSIDWSKEDLLAVATNHLLWKVIAYTQYANSQNGKPIQELSSREILDYIFRIDMLVKVEEGYVGLDVTGDPCIVDNKKSEWSRYTSAYQCLGIYNMGVALCQFDLEPAGSDLKTQVALFENFVNKLVKNKSLTKVQSFR